MFQSINTQRTTIVRCFLYKKTGAEAPVWGSYHYGMMSEKS